MGNTLNITRFWRPAGPGERRMVQLAIGGEFIGLDRERTHQLIDILSKAWEKP